MRPTKRGVWGAPRLKQIIIGLIFIPLLLLPSAIANATGASGLSISPLRQELTLGADETYTIPITLKNVTGGAIIAKPLVRDFTSDNVDGNPKIITNSNYSNPDSIRNFIVGLGNIPLAEGEQLTFNVTIKVPSSAVPGAYYGLIEYQAVPSNSNVTGNNKVALTAAVSELVFITVPGNVTQKVELNAIHVYHDKVGNSEGLLFTSPPKAMGVSLSNLANAFEKPFGTVTIQNFTGKTVETYQVNSGQLRGLVLPYSSRTFVNMVKKISTPGPYTVTASISYGSGSAILIAKKTFWYLPLWIIVILILIILLLIGLIWLARRRFKRVTNTRYSR